ncbi:FMN-dependent NADH-azoreductase [Clostridium sp. B9]|uniref:FMN-dependent NADH-azoreductase n=1 Tax=Clostridium sp. B9 TaxID=3423224 RepID=UPI003D2EA1D9
MKKLLYITVNSKPEKYSSSKTIGRAFVSRYIELNPEFEMEEVDLYKDFIPRLEDKHFSGRSCCVDPNDEKLDPKTKKEVERIIELSNQFKEADLYVIAAPLWSLSFPAPLKEYIDCIIQNKITIKISPEEVKGLLDDKQREMVYIQSSGGEIPWLTRNAFNKGLNYVEDIMKFLGIKKFHQLLVDGTGYSKEEKFKAEDKAVAKMDDVIKSIYFSNKG